MSFAADPATLTKEKLKSELSKNKVPLPPADARKDVYVGLYKKHLSPMSESVMSKKFFGFSSDDDEEDIQNSPRKRKKKPGSAGVKQQNVKPVLDVTKLSDDELYKQLSTMGVPVGPIQDTTRGVYERKLKSLLDKETKSDGIATNGFGAEAAEDFSDDEVVKNGIVIQEIVQEVQAKPQRSPKKASPTKKPSEPKIQPEIRQRSSRIQAKAEAKEAESTSYENDPDQTSVIRVNLRSSNREKIIEKKAETKENTTHVAAAESSTKGRRIPIFVQILLVAVLALFIYLVFINMDAVKGPPKLKGKP